MSAKPNRFMGQVWPMGLLPINKGITLSFQAARTKLGNMSSHIVFTESKKYSSSPKETSFSPAPNSKIVIPLKTNLEIVSWNSHRQSRRSTIMYHLVKKPEHDIET